MKSKYEFKCPLCGDKLIPREMKDGNVVFICNSNECMAEIRFTPMVNEHPITSEEAFKRIQRRPNIV